MNRECQEIRNCISDSISGTLSEANECAVREHLNSCADCRRYAQALEREDGLLADHFAQVDAEMDSRLGRVLQRIEDTPKVKRGRPILVRSTMRIAAAIVIVAVTALLVIRSISDNPKAATTRQETAADIKGINAIALNMAYRRGGMEAVEEQYRKSSPGVEAQPVRLSVQTLLAELTENGES